MIVLIGVCMTSSNKWQTANRYIVQDVLLRHFHWKTLQQRTLPVIGKFIELVKVTWWGSPDLEGALCTHRDCFLILYCVGVIPYCVVSFCLMSWFHSNLLWRVPWGPRLLLARSGVCGGSHPEDRRWLAFWTSNLRFWSKTSRLWNALQIHCDMWGSDASVVTTAAPSHFRHWSCLIGWGLVPSCSTTESLPRLKLHTGLWNNSISLPSDPRLSALNDILFLEPVKIITITHFYLFSFSLRIILWLNYF